MNLTKSSFQFLLLKFILAMAVALGLPTYVLVTYAHQDQLVDGRASELLHLADSVAAVLSQNLQERSREIELLAQSPLYVRGALDSPDIRANLARVQRSYPIYSWIGVADLQGNVLSATQDMLVGKSVAQRPWFQKGREATYAGDLHDAPLLGNLLKSTTKEWPIRFIDFTSPIRGEDGQVRGVLGAHTNWRWAGEVVGSVTPMDANTTRTEIFIVNQRLEVMYPSVASAGGNEMRVPEIKAGQSIGFLSWGGPEQYLTTASAVKPPPGAEHLGWQVYVRQPRSQVEAELARLQRGIVLIVGVAGVAFVLVAWWMGRRISRPIRELADAAAAVAARQEHSFEVAAPTVELQRLQEALSTMSQSLLHQQREMEMLNQQLEAKVAERTNALIQAVQNLRSLARQDNLTGLANRLAAEEWLNTQFKLMKRHGVGYAVLGVDIDHFKRVNDGHGHAVGDQVLRHVAQVIAASVRDTDLVARMGGEEFSVFLPMTGIIDAALVAEKIRSSVENSPIEPVGVITLSIGVALAAPEDEDFETAIKSADARLYEAKQAGRNCVVKRQ